MEDRLPLTMTVDGRLVSSMVRPRHLLGDFLRDHAGGTGVHLACGQGVCGACTVVIDGSPTVDPALGQVMVGTADGAVDAISTATGQTVWSASVAGAANAPTFANGEAYVSSTGGTVTEFTSPVTGLGLRGIAVAPDGSLWLAEPASGLNPGRVGKLVY